MLKPERIWVVLRFENDYNQEGGYFTSAHLSREECISPNGHFGREGYENTWYVRRKVTLNTTFHSDTPLHNPYELTD